MPKTQQSRITLTVTGTLDAMFPAKGRPGCVLELSNGRDTGLYYVPLSPHDCRREFPERTVITFRVYADQKPDPSGVIDTAGPKDRFWDTVKA